MISILENLKIAHIFSFRHICLCNIFTIGVTLVSMNNLRDKELLIKFGNRLKTIRNERNMTLEQLAFASDIEISQVHRVEKGSINPTLSTLSALAKGLNMTIAELIGDTA
jgi:DNA-binding XRE family transcriptional regulator